MSTAAAANAQSTPSTAATGAHATADDTSSLPPPLPQPAAPIPTLLSAFLKWDQTTQLVSHHIGRFLTLRKEQKHSQSAHDKLVSTANARPPHITLPKQLAIRVSDNIKLPLVADAPQFFKEELDAVRTLELDTNKQVYALVIKARLRHINHLATQSNPPTFMNATMIHITKFVADYAKHIDAAFDASTVPTAAAASPAAAAAASDAMEIDSTVAFPRQDAIASLRKTLQAEIDQAVSRLAQAEVTDAAAKAAARKVDLDAQERTQHGAHSGENIAMIATRAAQKVVTNGLKPIQARVDALADGTPTTKRAKTSHKTTVDQGDQQNTVPSRRIIQHDANDTEMDVGTPAPIQYYFDFGPAVLQAESNKLKRPRVGPTQPKARQHHNAPADTMEDNDGQQTDDRVDSLPTHRSQSSFHRGGVPRNTHRPQSANRTKRTHKENTSSSVRVSAKHTGRRQ